MCKWSISLQVILFTFNIVKKKKLLSIQIYYLLFNSCRKLCQRFSLKPLDQFLPNLISISSSVDIVSGDVTNHPTWLLLLYIDHTTTEPIKPHYPT